MNRKKNKTEGEYIMELIDKGEPFEDQYICHLSIGITKLKADKEQIILNKDMEKMTGLDETITVNELAEALGKSKRTIQRRTKKEKWPVEILNRRGDQRFIVNELPEDVRVAMMAKRVTLGLRAEIQKLDEQIKKTLGQKKKIRDVSEGNGDNG